MANKIASGIDLVEEIEGHGYAAEKGDKLIYNARLFLHRGDEVTWDAGVIEREREHVTSRMMEGVEVIDHVTVLGKRHTMAGIEKSLYAMRAGGYREIIVAPHLAYRDEGLPGLIPPRAMIRVRLWVQEIVKARDIGPLV